MLSEQQQRIMGYFIEEAKDHLNTIEQGLLNLQATIADPEMASEVFRAAHSVKGGAAMLGLDSIQHTAHRLEDYFKVLKECPLQVDQKLETLLLRVFDSLQELLEQLQGPFGLTEDKAATVMTEAEPVFTQLNQHLSELVRKSGATPPDDVQLATPTAASTAETPDAAFGREVPARLRDMLAQFKQADTAATREQLQEICRSLGRLGERFSLTQWSGLVALAQQAIATDNSYRALAPVLIKDIKQAYELVLAGRTSEIQPSADLQGLVPVNAPDLLDLLTPDEAALSAPLFDFEPLPDAGDVLNADEATSDWFTAAADDSANGVADLADFDTLSNSAPQNGPEVGLAELNSLADLFEGELPDLGLNWQEEAIDDEINTAESLDLDSSSDFSDLLFDQPEPTVIPEDEDLSGLLSSAADAFEADASEADASETNAELAFDLFAEPAAEESNLDLTGLAFTDAIEPARPEALGDLNGLFADIEAEAPASSDADALDDLFGDDADALFATEPDEPTSNDASLELDGLELDGLELDGLELDGLELDALDLSALVDADAPAESIALDDPFALPAIDAVAPDADLDAMLSGIDAIEPEPAAEAPWQDAELTSDLWDSGSLSLGEVATLDDPFALASEPPASIDSSADLFTESAANADPVDAALPDLEQADGDAIDEAITADDLLNLDALVSTDEEPFDLNDLLGESDALAADADASGSLNEVIFLPDAGAIDAPSLEDDSLDALFGRDSDAAIADDAAFADLLAPVESEADESDFDLLLEEPASVEPESRLDSAIPIESTDFGLLESSDSDAIDADLFGLPLATDSTADEADLQFEPSDSIESALFDLTTDEAQAEPFDLLAQPVESDLNADFFSIAEDDSSDQFDLFKQPESDAIEPDLFDLPAEDRVSSEESDDLDLLLAPPEPDLLDADLFDLAAEERTESIEANDLFGLTADDSEMPLRELSESDLGADQPLLGEGLDSIEADLSATDDLLALNLDETDDPSSPDAADDLWFADLDAGEDSEQNSEATAQNPIELPVELLDFEAAIDLTAPASQPDPPADRLADSELEFDFDALEDSLEADSLESDSLELDSPELDSLLDGTASDEDLFDLLPADAASMFDPDAIESPAEELAPFDLDAALMEASEPATPEADVLNLTDLDDLFALEETAPTEAIDADDFDLLLSAEAETSDPEMLRNSELEDLDELLLADAIDLPNEQVEAEVSPSEVVAPPLETADLEAGFEADLAAQSIDLNDLDDLLTPLPDEEDQSDALLSDALLFDDFAENSVTGAEAPDEPSAEPSAEPEEFADLEALLESPMDPPSSSDDFADLAALLESDPDELVSGFSTEQDAVISGFADDTDEEFASLDALLSDSPAAPANEFDDLEKLLENADQTLGGSPSERGVRRPSLTPKKRSPGVLKDQNMRVSVKNLDNLNNLVGELVVNRNSLEQTQERVRQFLDNLVYQVQQLSDVGQRMRDLYERSLLESSLLSSRRSYQLSSQGAPPAPASHSTGLSFDALEMDRFTGFHTLSQEMIELIVRVRESASDIDRMVDESDQITRMFRQVTTQLQEGLTRSRMVPFDQTAARMPRAVRDISLKCGKQAELVVEGKETLIDKMILEQLYDPMTHLVNNAITHGIETPADRQAAGKPPTGRITIRAFHQGNQTVISVTDDGAGIDPEAVKRKAIEKNLITPAEAREMTRLDVYDLLFLHGFSTRDRADDFAGRGVGMDVVRTSLNEVRGTVNIDSTIGRGTTFTVRLPLTLSISKALCCISNRARIAFPMDGVEDMFDVPREQVQTDSEGRACIQWRDTLLPFQPLAELLRYSRNLGRGSVYGGNQDEDIVSVVVLRSNAGSFLALQVDQVLGEQEIVIKQLEGPVPKPVGVAGATVLGDGHIMPIADVLELIDLSQGRIRREPGSSLWEKADGQAPIEPPVVKNDPTVLIVDDSITVRELLSMTFNKVGYRVEQARDGQEAWEKLRSGLPCDLVFCDIEMPRMDGLELLSRIQKDPNLNHLPIAMLTSRGADRHRQMAVQLGAKGYFTKPYLEESLLDAAGRMLKGEVLVS